MRFASIVIALCLVPGTVSADFRRFQAVSVDAALERQVQAIAEDSLVKFGGSGLRRENLSMTLLDLSDPAAPRRGAFQGSTAFHPASVVKLFYLAYAHHLRAEGKIVFDEELTRALRDMIVLSSNDATSYVVDRITGTTSGPELHGRAFAKFEARRRAVNRWLEPMGYDVNAMTKTFCEDIYGRDRQLLGPNREYRNRFSSESFAAMMLWIVRREAVSPEASEQMLALLKRLLPSDNPEKNDEQVVEFTGQALPPGSRLWSKAGWTSEVRNDVAYVELPGGKRYILAVMTRGAAEDKTILPWISQRVIAAMSGE